MNTDKRVEWWNGEKVIWWKTRGRIASPLEEKQDGKISTKLLTFNRVTEALRAQRTRRKD